METDRSWILVAVADSATRRNVRNLMAPTRPVLFASTGHAARDILDHNPAVILITDPPLLRQLLHNMEIQPGRRPRRLVTVVNASPPSRETLPPQTTVVTLSAPDAARALYSATRLGAAARSTAGRQLRFPGCDGMVGDSPAMRLLFDRLRRVAGRDSTVLIQGESGTGKALAARAIHNHSPRRHRPFKVFDCAAISPALMESTLFGHRRGAFTGAERHRRGCLEAADGGTLFLDDIDAMGPAMQTRLLRVLQDRQFVRLGSNRVVRADLRFIAATNRNPIELVRTGALRADVYYRLDGLPIRMPPLRERPGDVTLLTDYFLRQLSTAPTRPVPAVAAATRRLLDAYAWPGNVRELRNVVERLLTLSDAPCISPSAVMPLLEPLQEPLQEPLPSENLRQETRKFQHRMICRALALAHGNRSRAAAMLGIHRNTLLSKLAAAPRAAHCPLPSPMD